MVRHVITVAFICVVIAPLSPVKGQQNPQHLKELWSRVEQNFSGLKARQSAVEVAKLDEGAIKSHMLPQLKAQAQNTYGTHYGAAGGFFPLPGLFNVSTPPNGGDGGTVAPYSFGSATVEWNLFSFGTLRKENKAAHSLTNAKSEEKEAYLLQLKKTLSERYIALLFYNAKINWNKKNLSRLNDIRKITAGLSASGLRPAADSLLALSSYTESLGHNDRLEGKKEASLFKLEELTREDHIPYEASETSFLKPGQTLKTTSGAPEADPSHPVLETLQYRKGYLKLKGEAQQSAALPSISLLGGYAYRGTGINAGGSVSGRWKDGFSNSANNYLIGVGITWNITDLHTNRLKSNSYFKDAERTGYLYTQSKDKLQADLSAARAEILQQFQQLQKTNKAVTQAQNAYDMYLARYKSGLIDLSSLLQIQKLLVDAEDSHLEASREYWELIAEEAALTTDFEFLFNNL